MIYDSVLLQQHTHTHTDDDNIITLKPLAQFSDCQNEFINASYIHVRTYTIRTLSLYVHTTGIQ